jgi:TonB-linked SusC/RagA family outer membrane protein
MKKDLYCKRSSDLVRFQKTALKNFSFFFFFLLVINTTFAQGRQVKGQVTDDKKAPLPNVSVLVKGTRVGVTTDANGAFSIQVPSNNSILVISYVGFQDQEITVGDKTSITVSLIPGSSQLSDVVVVGYGTAKKATLTGAISSIKGSEITKSPAVNVSNNLVGKLPGLSAIQSSGEPGNDGSSIRIRGFNTLNDNSVLVVVDGVPGRSLDRIDPNSIENVTVLKDASAAIYGARAANGVILITTKRGRTGKPQLGLTVNYGYNQPTVLPKMTDAATYAQMNNEIIIYYTKLSGHPEEWLAAYQALKETGVYNSPTIGVVNASSLPIDGSPEGIKLYQNGQDPWGHPNTDWFDAVLRKTSPQSSYNLTLSGGSESMRYFISLGKIGQDGNYYHSATRYDQYDFRTNIDGRINKNISLAFDVAGRLEDRHYPTRSPGDIFRMVQRGKPTLPAYWPDGTPGPDIEYGNNPAVISTDATGYDRDKNYVLSSNLKLVINIPWIKGLSFTGNAAIDKEFRFDKLWRTPWYLYTWDYATYDTVSGVPKPHLERGKRGYDAPSLQETYTDNYLSTVNGFLNYENIFGGAHTFKFLAGVEEIKGNSTYFTASRAHYVSTAFDQLFAGASLDQGANGSGSASTRLSYFGRVNYSYKTKYLAEFVWRYDGSYIFPEAKRFGFFPGVSLGWVASQEEFWKNINFINNFKLRASWGQTGNDRIQEWQYLGTYGTGNWFTGGPYYINYYPFVTNGSTENQTIYETRVPNPEVTWEVANQADVGFDASFLKNKLTIEADYFNYKRSKILIQPNASLPLSTGYNPPIKNIGKVSNQGFEVNVVYNGGNKNFSYKIGVNSSYAKNKITFWDETPGNPDYQKSTGHPMNTGLYYVAEGVFVDQAQLDKTPHWDGALPGDVIFKDVDNSGVIDANDRIRIDKSGFPTFIGGLNADLRYGQFDLSILFQGATGAERYIHPESGLIGDFLESFAEDRWTPENPSSTKPRAFDRDNPYWRGQNNTYLLHKTDYVRLKTLQFGYTLPESIINKLNIASARVYFSGYNLLTWAPDYKDFDPELSNNENDLASTSGQTYPLIRVISFGFSVNF